MPTSYPACQLMEGNPYSANRPGDNKQRNAVPGQAPKSAADEYTKNSLATWYTYPHMTLPAAIHQVFAEKPAECYPRKYLGLARHEHTKLYIQTMGMGTPHPAPLRFPRGTL